VIPDYRKYPAVRFPAFVEDGAKAVAWTYKNIASRGGDPKRLYLAGHSAGAHIGTLIASDPRYLQAENLDTGIIKAFAGLAGPYDFTPDEPDLIAIFGPSERYPQMRVTSFITGHEPPMLLLQGQNDTTVKIRNLKRLEARIREKGGRVETKIYPGVDHIQIVGSFAWFWHGRAPVAQDIAAFFNQYP
jgi:acetyl esterase/lipase